MPSSSIQAGLNRREVAKLVDKWIGVNGGYLGQFSYAKHDRFWLNVCGIEIRTGDFGGTTRDCFEATLYAASAEHQALVLRAILEEYPLNDNGDPQDHFRTDGLHAEILQWISRLERNQAAIPIQLASATEIVRRALDDADVLLQTSGPQSAVDRAHTALHGYLHALSEEAQIDSLPERPTMTQFFKALRSHHPALTTLGPRADDINRVMQGMANILDALNPVRNYASVAHPNQTLVGEPEAVLVINTVRTLLGYLEAKRQSLTNAGP